MCPQYILSDNRAEFKNKLRNQVLQQLGIDRIFSPPYHPQSNGKLEVFHKYLKPTVKKLCDRDPTNWDKYLNQLQDNTKSSDGRITILLSIWQKPQLPLHQLLEPMQHFLGDPDSGMLNLETHRLALAIAKKTLDEHRFTSIQKTMARDKPALPSRRSCIFQKQAAW